MSSARFSKILIANRGEIALRIQRTARELGYRTVAVYSEADRDAPFVTACDEAVFLGAAEPAASYLSIDAIIAAAKRVGAEAVHPGYGFLSEQAAFAEACVAAGLVFIGPSAASIRAMADKAEAKRLLRDADVPLIPGVELDLSAPDTWARAAAECGFPVLIKAAAGGGGRGMRLVERAEDLADAVARARSEAKNAFGHDGLLLEKALLSARHIEIQIAADQHGNRIHLGERDCSVQRRHQKVVEEAPSPAVDHELRETMGAVALRIAASVDYHSVGTVEFLLDDQGAFYFLEMNTRLQVEHGVTEMVTGLDLVALQLAVAQGEPLPLDQGDVVFDGHAVQVRLYAEDPARDYLPQTGTVHFWRPPQGRDIRVDHGLCDGLAVSAHYDAMVAKIMAKGPDRGTALKRLGAALRETRLLGVVHNADFLARVIAHPEFAAGRFSTSFLQQHFTEYQQPTVGWADLAAVWCIQRALLPLPAGAGDAWRGWFSGHAPARTLRLAFEARLLEGRVRELGNDHLAVTLGEQAGELVCHGCEAVAVAPTGARLFHLDLEQDGVRYRRLGAVAGARFWLAAEAGVLEFEDRGLEARNRGGAHHDGLVHAVMSGRVVDVAVVVGDRVAAGDLLAVLEAMKMEHRLAAPIDGEITVVGVAAGDQVQSRQLLIEVQPVSS
ncbi:ATP-binding protein [Acanthopleuribacter pedis]|uniref:Biotin/lipoyl-binding protein n=1 Tax=Acanthopleuribacter pedis TaxID=442870 RepID=A0A8J7QBF3_9BACT|nr:biotin/lipoyl-binding protein [Acanthopleuribacter pedis]